MATPGSSHLKDINEQFCQCPICLQQYREPKVLPCLHRYCSDCLKQVIERNQGVNVISCPECRDEFQIPNEGVDGFKTDFYMKNIIEYIQIQQSLKDEKLQECYNCSKTLKATAYCFKCNGFLCKECQEHHMKSKSLKDHRQHTLSLEDLKSKHMTLEKLSDLKEAPRCKSHPDDLCRLCCKTCNNLPICVTCTYGSHENHQIKDVKILATEEKGKLRNQLTSLSQNRNRILTISQTLEEVTKNILTNVQEKKENFQTIYEKDVQTAKKKIEKMEDDIRISQTEIENKKKRKLEEMRKQMDEEMTQLKEKYDNIFNEIEKESKGEICNLEQKHHEEVQNSREKVKMSEKEFQILIETAEKRKNRDLMKVQEFSKQIHGIVNRYENLTLTGKSVLETSNDWTALQCIPDISKAIEPLSEDMKSEFLELEELSRIGYYPEITEVEESPLTIEGTDPNGWEIKGVAVSDDGSIIISGLTPVNHESHITVIGMEGKLLHQKVMKSAFRLPLRDCAFLSKSKVATVCQADEIGVYDMRDGSYIRRNIRYITSSLPLPLDVSCVASDTGNKHIIVGLAGYKYVYVFDDQLNYLHALTLPQMIEYPYDMIFSEGNLLVCDLNGGRAYVISMERRKGKVIHEFKKPNFDRDGWVPLSVCTDSNGFIYILWTTVELRNGISAVAQYTQDYKLLTTKQIGFYACGKTCITTVKTGTIEKLLVSRSFSGELHRYSLM